MSQLTDMEIVTLQNMLGDLKDGPIASEGRQDVINMIHRLESLLMLDDVIHVFNSGGNHCLVVNGTRGDWTSYETMAIHPAGYCAVTDYCSGTYDRPYTLIDIQKGGRVWRLGELQSWRTTQTVPPSCDYLKMPMEESHRAFDFFNRKFDEDVPNANEARAEVFRRREMDTGLRGIIDVDDRHKAKAPPGFEKFDAKEVLTPAVTHTSNLYVDPPENDK